MLARACLRGRKADAEALQKNISACAAERNAARASIDWRFTAQDPEIKLSRLYPRQS